MRVQRNSLTKSNNNCLYQPTLFLPRRPHGTFVENIFGFFNQFSDDNLVATDGTNGQVLDVRIQDTLHLYRENPNGSIGWVE